MVKIQHSVVDCQPTEDDDDYNDKDDDDDDAPAVSSAAPALSFAYRETHKSYMQRRLQDDLRYTPNAEPVEWCKEQGTSAQK